MLLVDLDLAGADWAVTAYVANEPRMIEVHRSGVSPHQITGELITGAPQDLIIKEDKLLGKITDAGELEAARKEQVPEIFEAARIFLPRVMTIRQAAKKANHALNYGMGPDRFSLENFIPVPEARRLHSLYLTQAYPGLKKWHKALTAQVKKTRTLTNCFGRKVCFMGALGADLWDKAYAWIPQSTVADISIGGFVAMFADERKWMRAAEPLAQVHDSILFQYPEQSLHDLAACIVEVAFGTQFLRPICTYNEHEFQLDVECKIGRSWGEGSAMTEIPLVQDVEAVAGYIQEVFETKLAAAA